MPLNCVLPPACDLASCVWPCLMVQTSMLLDEERNLVLKFKVSQFLQSLWFLNSSMNWVKAKVTFDFFYFTSYVLINCFATILNRYYILSDVVNFQYLGAYVFIKKLFMVNEPLRLFCFQNEMVDERTSHSEEMKKNLEETELLRNDTVVLKEQLIKLIKYVSYQSYRGLPPRFWSYTLFLPSFYLRKQEWENTLKYRYYNHHQYFIYKAFLNIVLWS